MVPETCSRQRIIDAKINISDHAMSAAIYSCYQQSGAGSNVVCLLCIRLPCVMLFRHGTIFLPSMTQHPHIRTFVMASDVGMC